MKFDFLDRRRAERFAELLDETGGGRRHHSRGQADEELAELVAIGHSLSAVRSGAHVQTEFRTGLRAMLVATAERDGIGDTAATEPAGHTTETRSLLSFSGRRIRARGAIVIGVAAGAMAVSGISAASENAAPGDALYGVKRSTERAQLAMAGSDVTRGQLSLDFARNRLTEAAALPNGADGFSGVLNDMDADTRQGVKLLTEAAVARQDKAPLTRIDSFVTGQRKTFGPVLDKLAPADRERAETSLALLDDVEARTGELRSGLACGTVSKAGADSLGPRVHDCMAGQDSSGAAGDKQGHGQKTGSKTGTKNGGDSATTEPRPAKTDPTDQPDANDPTGTATTGTGKKPSVAPSTKPAPAQSVPADRDSEQDKGVLDGLIGIFG